MYIHGALVFSAHCFPGGVAEEWWDHWPGGGQKLLHHHRPQPDHQAGAALRHRQLHVRGQEHRGEEKKHDGNCYRLRWVACLCLCVCAKKTQLETFLLKAVIKLIYLKCTWHFMCLILKVWPVWHFSKCELQLPNIVCDEPSQHPSATWN